METCLNSHTKPSPLLPQTTERTAGSLSQVLPRLLLSAPSHTAGSHGGDSLDPKLQGQGLNGSPATSLECIAAFRSSGHLFSGGGTCSEAPEYLLDFKDHVLGT